jgi:hypothetical protein
VTDPAERDIDPGPAIQAAAERHLNACWDAHYAEEEAEDGAEEVPSPAVGPFCGCETCIVRECIAGAWPVIEAYFSLQIIRARERDDLRAAHACACAASPETPSDG